MAGKVPKKPKVSTGHLTRYPFGGKLKADESTTYVEGAKARGSSNPHRFSRYILTVYRNDESDYSVAFPSTPTSKRYSHRPAAEIRYTLDEMPIREHATGRSWSVSFTGMVGFDTRQASRADGGTGHMAGIEAMLQFDAFILGYHKQAEQDGSLYLGAAVHRPMLDRTYLVLYDMDEGLSYRVEMTEWDWDRGPRTRVGNSEWRLTLHAYSPQQVVKHSWWRGNTHRGRSALAAGKYRQERRDRVELDRLFADSLLRRDALFVSSWILDVRSLELDEAHRLLRELEVPLGVLSAGGVQSEIADTVLQAARSWVTKLQDIQSMGADITRAYYDSVPRQAIIAVIVAGETFLQMVQSLKYAGVSIVTDPQGMFGRVQQIAQRTVQVLEPLYDVLASLHALLTDVVTTQVTGLIGNFGVIPNVQGVQPLTSPPPKGTTVYTTQPGDSWQAIALWYYNDANVWQTLAAFNGASSAYKGAGGLPLMPGTQVFFPGTAATSSSSESSANPDSLFGTDIFIDLATGDLVVDDESTIIYAGGVYTTTPAQGRDVRLVAGTDNLVHSLAHQLLTVRGEVTSVPEYGVLPLEPGEPLTEENYASIVIGVVDGLSQDARVLQVDQVQPLIDKDRVSLSVRVVPVSGTAVGVVVPIGG